jgi:hypothetical protein
MFERRRQNQSGFLKIVLAEMPDSSPMGIAIPIRHASG